MTKQIKPLHDKVLIEQAWPEETDSGIILPDSVKKTMLEPVAYVLAVGTDEDITVKVGDKILFDPNGLLVYPAEGQDYLFLRHKSILAVIGKREIAE